MRLLRMTTRRWMVTVAVIGVMSGGVVGGVRLKRRHDGFQARARFYIQYESSWKKMEGIACAHLQGLEEQSAAAEPRPDLVADWKENIKECRRWAVYNAGMARKYRHAARFPWLPVEPDPPLPDPWLPVEPDPPLPAGG